MDLDTRIRGAVKSVVGYLLSFRGPPAETNAYITRIITDAEKRCGGAEVVKDAPMWKAFCAILAEAGVEWGTSPSSQRGIVSCTTTTEAQQVMDTLVETLTAFATRDDQTHPTVRRSSRGRSAKALSKSMPETRPSGTEAPPPPPPPPPPLLFSPPRGMLSFPSEKEQERRLLMLEATARAQNFVPQDGITTKKRKSTDGPVRRLSRSKRIDPVDKKRCCNCKNSQCLKLYCECFHAGVYCDGCNCLNCLNNKENEHVRREAVEAILERNPGAFRPKIVEVEEGAQGARHMKGCHCKKSGCLKRYCECFQAGVLCTEHCKCFDCKNYEGSLMLQATVRGQRRRDTNQMGDEIMRLDTSGQNSPKSGASGDPPDPTPAFQIGQGLSTPAGTQNSHLMFPGPFACTVDPFTAQVVFGEVFKDCHLADIGRVLLLTAMHGEERIATEAHDGHYYGNESGETVSLMCTEDVFSSSVVGSSVSPFYARQEALVLETFGEILRKLLAAVGKRAVKEGKLFLSSECLDPDGPDETR